MNQFSNKVAVITGAASGIGKALARKCLEHQIKVVLADVNEDKLLECKNDLLKINNNILSVVTNVAEEKDVINLAHEALDKFGSVNFLFNNAGIAGSLAPIWAQPAQDIRLVIDVNLMGVIYGLQSFIPIMLNQKDECFIINTSAGAGLLTGQGLSAYKASKHGIIAISEVLFNDLKQINANINVSVLIPHWVDTEMPKSIHTTDQELINSHLSHLKNFGMSPNLVADKVFEGIKNKSFYIFTNFDEHRPKIEKRMQAILALSDPC